MTEQNDVYICVLDFEATCWEDMANKKHEVIEFPSVLLKWNKDKKEVIKLSEIQMYIKPKYNSTLSDFCTNLTGITQNLVDNGISFPEGLVLVTKNLIFLDTVLFYVIYLFFIIFSQSIHFCYKYIHYL